MHTWQFGGGGGAWGRVEVKQSPNVERKLTTTLPTDHAATQLRPPPPHRALHTALQHVVRCQRTPNVERKLTTTLCGFQPTKSIPTTPNSSCNCPRPHPHHALPAALTLVVRRTGAPPPLRSRLPERTSVVVNADSRVASAARCVARKLTSYAPRVTLSSTRTCPLRSSWLKLSHDALCLSPSPLPSPRWVSLRVPWTPLRPPQCRYPTGHMNVPAHSRVTQTHTQTQAGDVGPTNWVPAITHGLGFPFIRGCAV